MTRFEQPGSSLTGLFSKTKMCKSAMIGMCTRGEGCTYAHGPQELQPLPKMYKTKMCRALSRNKECHDPSCQYAHTKSQLRNVAYENLQEDDDVDHQDFSSPIVFVPNMARLWYPVVHVGAPQQRRKRLSGRKLKKHKKRLAEAAEASRGESKGDPSQPKDQDVQGETLQCGELKCLPDVVQSSQTAACGSRPGFGAESPTMVKLPDSLFLKGGPAFLRRTFQQGLLCGPMPSKEDLRNRSLCDSQSRQTASTTADSQSFEESDLSEPDTFQASPFMRWTVKNTFLEMRTATEAGEEFVASRMFRCSSSPVFI